jgi:hypothetical protein
MADSIYHGLVDDGNEVEVTAYPTIMTKKSKNRLLEMYGNGFTLYAKLDIDPVVPSSKVVMDRISSKYYDCVIFPKVYLDVWEYSMFPKSLLDNWHFYKTCIFESVKKFYSKDKVHFVDGADQDTNIFDIYKLSEFGTLWKRELRQKKDNVNSISFAIPESQFIKKQVKKTKMFPDKLIAPRFNVTTGKSVYTFEKEEEYYQEYAESYYGVTTKRAGWDCMRHYEILANKTIPCFLNLEMCPPHTLTSLPKKLILECNKYSTNNKMHPRYDDVNEELFAYTKENLSTKKLVQRFY